MSERLDFSIRHSIPAKGSFLQLFSVVTVNFGADRALMGAGNHGGAVVITTESLAREKDYLVRIQLVNNNPEVPFLLEVRDADRAEIFRATGWEKNGKLNFVMRLPESVKGPLKLSLAYDEESKEYLALSNKATNGDYSFASFTIEAL